MKEIRGWMIALCMSCILGAMAGVVLGELLWHAEDPSTQFPHDTRITLHVHMVPGEICKDNIPCMHFDRFTYDDFDKTCYQNPKGNTDKCYPK